MATPASQTTDATTVAAPAIADPAPLGLAGFAMTTFVLSLVNANILAASLGAVVLPLALFYGGLAQLLAGMWEFKNKNTFGAVAFTSYGAFWLAYDAYVKFVAGGLPAATAYQATGVFLLAWTIFTAYMLIASLGTNRAVFIVFLILVVTFVLLTIGAFAQNATITKIGGYLGILTAIAAWYTSFATVTNATWKRTVIPVGPFNR